MKCSICGRKIEESPIGWGAGHNAEPVNDGRCCDVCNTFEVIPRRLELIAERTKK